ncbi:MAG: type II toxin-antitoxin system RelE/ParE family toxin [Candidatus Sumerlaeia bacterium]
MQIELIEIPGVSEEWEMEHKIRAVAINGRSDVLSFLWEVAKSKGKKGKSKAWMAMRLIAENASPPREPHVKKCKGIDEDIYEMRQNNYRIFFFYSEDGQAIAVCTNRYQKGKGNDRKAQNEAIKKAAKLRILCREYLKI